MKKINFKWLFLIFVLLIGCEKDSDSFDPGKLIEGTYYQEGDDYVHLEIVNSGTNIYVYVSANQPNSYCNYRKTGEISSTSFTGLEVEGTWFTFYTTDSYCSDYSYSVVQQKDKNTIIVQRSSYDYEYAYSYGSTLTFKK